MRGHGRTLVVAAVAIALVGGCSSGGSGGSNDTTATTAPAEAAAPTATPKVVPLPDSVTEVQLPWWTADGSAIVASARSKDFSGMQIVRFAPDGSGFTCLTCDIAKGDPPLMKPIAFDDGTRVLVRIGNQTPFTNGTHAVLECRPSVVQCDDAALVPIEVPADDLAIQDQREFRVAPGGERVAFTQVRNDDRGAAVFCSVVAGLERQGDHYALVDPRVVSTRGEFKQFSPDGSKGYVAAFTDGVEAANGDDLEVDLATGKVTRLTYHPDYDEPVEPSPDGRWFTVGSARTAHIFDPLSRLRRPNVLGAAIQPLSLYLFVTYRDELLEPWLISPEGEQAGETGVLLNPGSIDDGWEGRMIPNWNPDGRRIVFWEAAEASTAGTADAGSRVVVTTLDGLGKVGQRPDPVSPDLSWAPKLIGFAPPEVAIPESRDGKVSGKMTVTVGNVGDGGDTLEIAVTYTDFSDDGQWVLDGNEHITDRGGPTGTLTYEADIDLSGDHTGSLTATGVRGGPGGFVGTIESTVDGDRRQVPLG